MAAAWPVYHLDHVDPYTALEKTEIAERIWRQAGLRRPDHARQRPQLVVPTSIRFRSTEKRLTPCNCSLEGLSKYFIWLQDTLRNWDPNPHVDTYAMLFQLLDEIKMARAFRNRPPNKTQLQTGLRHCNSFARINLGTDVITPLEFVVTSLG
jgi:hypothetical protein